MMEYKTFEDELDAIRLAIYEEIKDMTSEEETAYFRKKTEPIPEKSGIRAIKEEIVRWPVNRKEAALS